MISELKAGSFQRILSSPVSAWLNYHWVYYSIAAARGVSHIAKTIKLLHDSAVSAASSFRSAHSPSNEAVRCTAYPGCVNKQRVIF